jgi:hypothetical protein
MVVDLILLILFSVFEDSYGRTVKTGHQKQDIWDKTNRTGQPGRENWNIQVIIRKAHSIFIPLAVPVY